MARLAQNSLYQAIGLIGAYDEKIAHSIEEGEDQIDMYAVSYTHLDVYKRQSLLRPF